MKLRFFFDNGCCLWIGDDEARARWEAGPVDERCGLSKGVIDRIAELSAWHDTDRNQDDPGGHGLWNDQESARFDAAARELLERIRAELGPSIEVVDRHRHNEFEIANQIAAQYGLPPGRVTLGDGVALIFERDDAAVRLTNDSERIRVDVSHDAGWHELFRAPVWNGGEEGFDETTGLSFSDCLNYGFELLAP